MEVLPSARHPGFRSRSSKPKLDEQRGGSLVGGGGFEPAHGSTVELGELKLVARSRRRLESSRFLWRLRNYFGAKLGVAGEDAKIAHQMNARWWDCRDEADDEVAGRKQECAGALRRLASLG